MDAKTRIVALVEFHQSLMRMQDESFFFGLAEFIPTKGVPSFDSASKIVSGFRTTHP